MQDTSIKVTGYRRYIGDKKFYSHLLFIALPVIAQAFIQNFVSLIDNFMVAGLGDIKMSGVNIAGQINFVFFVLIGTVCSSAGIFMCQYRGAGDKEGMKQAFRFKLLLTLFFGVLYTLLCALAPRGLFSLMVKGNLDAEAIIDQAVKYSRAVSPSFIFMCISISIGTSLRENEHVKSPLVIGSIATLTNTLFNFLLIYGNFFFPRLEVVGAAIATIIAHVIECIIFIVYVHKKNLPFIFNIRKLFSINTHLFTRIISKSFMILYSELAWAVCETVSIALYNTRGGAEVVSGMAAGFAIGNLVLISCQGVSQSVAVIMGAELGAGKLEECKIKKNWALTGSFLFGLLFILLGFLCTGLIPLVFMNLSIMAKTYARQLLIVLSLYLPLWAYINAQYSILRSGGDTFNGVISDTIANILFIGGMFYLTFCTSIGPVGMYAIVKLSDLAKLVVSQCGLVKEKWLKNLTIT